MLERSMLLLASICLQRRDNYFAYEYYILERFPNSEHIDIYRTT